MNKIAGVFLLLGLLILPAALMVGFSYTGAAHPLERYELRQDGFLNDSINDIEILFFGFAGCTTVCPTSLGKIASVLESEQLNDGQYRVGGMFVEVKSKTEDTQNSTYTDQYSRIFSSKIRGYTPNIKTYQQLASEFSIRLYESRDDAGRISHTDHFFILVRDKNKWTIDRVLSNQIDESLMIEVVSRTLIKI